jgi:serine protease
MKRSGVFTCAVVVAGLSLSSEPTRGAGTLRVASSERAWRGSGFAARPDEVIVVMSATADDRDASRVMWEAGGARAQRSAYGRRFRLTLDAGFTVEEAMRRLRQMPEVAHVEPNYLARAHQARAGHFAPNDEFYRFQWNMRLINAERTWGIQKGDQSVAVAVIDTGVAYEDFGPFRKAPDWGDTVFLPGYDFVNRDSHANDDAGHGTHVASTIAEEANNTEGVAGLAFNCAIMPLKVLDAEGEGSFFDIADAIDFAVNFTQGGQKPVKVINLSLGGPGESRVVREAIDRAVGAGVTVVASSGNDDASTVDFPAAFAAVIAVGAVDQRKVRARYSNYGSALDLVAPGGDLRRDDDNDRFPDGIAQQTFDPDAAAELGRYDQFDYYLFNGTSMAAPHVSAAAALLYRQGITNPFAIQRALEQTAEELGAAGRDDQYGHGLIQPAEALKGLGLNR